MKKSSIIIIFIFIISGIFYYNIASSSELQSLKVKRAIDGDTIELENNIKIRLMGINTPEKSEPFYQEAKNFLKKYENKSIQIQHKGTDRYSRFLAYIYYKGKLINAEIIKQGLAHAYFYEKDEHYDEIISAEKQAIKNQLGIWKKSPKSECIKLINLQYKEKQRCNNQEQLILENFCQTLNLTIKDSATHIFKEKINNGIFTKNFSCIWNNDGDNLFIYDTEGLVLHYQYP